MNSFPLIGAALCLIFSSGCKTTPTPVAISPQSSATVGTGAAVDTSMTAEFQRGKAFLESGNHMAAIKQFAYLRDHAGTSDERDRAVIGLSMALQDSGKSGAALGTLEPLPELPTTGLEAMKCILAGELYLHQQNFELAQIWLLRGLEVEPESRKRLRASALFNLGKAFLADDNLDEAQTAFENAQEVFRINGDEVNAGECQVIISDIRRALQ